MRNEKTILWWVLGIFCMAASLSSAVLIDDFESYDTSASTKLSDQGSAWTTITSSTGTVNVFGAPDNQYLTYGYYNTGSESRGAFIAAPAIDDTSTGTLFLRIYVETGGTLNHSFGLTDSEPGSGDFGAYEAQMVVAGGATASQFELRVRDGVDFVAVTDTLDRDTWYNIWAVVDNATDTFDVYATTAEKLFPVPADKLATGVDFRNGTVDDLNRFFAFAGPGDPRVRIDDIYLTDGVSLSNPTNDISPAHNPSPANIDTPVAYDADLTLQWDAGMAPSLDPNIWVPNPDISTHNLTLSVAFPTGTTDPNWINPASILQTWTIGADIAPADGDVDPDSQQVVPAASLNPDSVYFWKVDEYVTGAVPAPTDPNNILGNTWSFQTDTVAPTVEAGDSVVTWLENGSSTVNLNGTVTYVSPAVEDFTLWSVYNSPSAIPGDPNVSIANTGVIDTAATFTRTGQFALELYAKDSAGAEASDRVEVTVYADSCVAAQNNPNNPTLGLSTYDFNSDCLVNLDDFALFAAAWLNDRRLTAVEYYDAGIISVPTIIINEPLDGATVSGIVTIDPTVYDEYVGTNDGDGINTVWINVYKGTDPDTRVLVDGNANNGTAAPYTYDWDSLAGADSDGIYTIRVSSQSLYGFSPKEIIVTLDNTP